MVSGHLQGSILKMFCRMVHPHRVLELGTFTGYSALCFAAGMDEDGEVHTIEIDDEIEDFTRSFLSRSPYGNKIKLIIGDALDIIPTLTEVYDLVFIDANKRDYLHYYEAVLPLVRPGGFILADNTLWDGKVITDPHSRDAQTIGIEHFNDTVAQDTRVEKSSFHCVTDSRFCGKTAGRVTVAPYFLLLLYNSNQRSIYGDNTTK